MGAFSRCQITHID